MLKKILKLVEWIVFVALIGLFAVVISPVLPINNIPRTFIVVSGSMEPTIKTGSIVLTKPIDATSVKKDDIIAFTSPNNPKDTIMHRVAEVKAGPPLTFSTKGDNNNAADAWDVYGEGIKGVMVASVPYLGHAAAYMRKPVGFGIMIGIPALIIIMWQIVNIKKAIKEEIKKGVEKEISKKKILPIIAVMIMSGLICSGLSIKTIQASYKDKVEVTGISIATADYFGPDKPEILLPENNSELNNVSLRIKWTPLERSGKTTRYVAELTDKVGYTRTIGPTQLTDFEEEITDNDYYLKVKACFDEELDDCTDWSETIFFKYYHPFDINNLQALVASPDEANEPKVIFTWNTDLPCKSILYMRTDVNEEWVEEINDEDIQTEHKLEFTNLMPNTKYYFNVLSQNVFDGVVAKEISVETGDIRMGTAWSDVVINEFLPNPIGDDTASYPNGEWVELYNRGDKIVDLSGWYLTDANPTHKLIISLDNTIKGGRSPDDLTIKPGEFIVVYRNGDSDFDLGNSNLGDAVSLFRKNWYNLMDSHIYTGLLGDDIFENKSFIRFPDGANVWFDPIPSPGGPNTLDDGQMEIDLEIINDKLVFKAVNLPGKIYYEITYLSVGVEKGIAGESDEQTMTREFDIGSCSQEVCIRDQVDNNLFKLSISGAVEMVKTFELPE